jgi:hypothetical protein
MTPSANPNQHEKTLSFAEGTKIEYKYRRDGTWDKVEKQANGDTEVPNREFTVGYAEDGPFALNDTVANWADVLVTATSPADGATGIPVATDIAVDLNKPVNASSEFEVLDDGGDPVSGSFVRDDG